MPLGFLEPVVKDNGWDRTTHICLSSPWDLETGISPCASASQLCHELVVALRENVIISLGLLSHDSCIRSAYSFGVRSKVLQYGLFHTSSGSAVTLDSLLDQKE